jgi:DNA invertase Pin-like site-specific DNA recombinase
MSWKIGYARVSREGQTNEQQIAALKAEGCREVFVETASGARTDRPELAKALAAVREGDSLVIWKLDRLARSTKHLIELKDTLESRGIQLVSITDRIDTSQASGKLLFTVLGAIAQFERDVVIERVNAGLVRAKAEGKVGGRPRADKAKIEHGLTLVKAGLGYGKAAKLAGVGAATLHRAADHSENPKIANRNGRGFRNGSGTVTPLKLVSSA